VRKEDGLRKRRGSLFALSSVIGIYLFIPYFCEAIIFVHIFIYLFRNSASSGGILDRAIEAEDKKHQDFMRLVYVLSSVIFALKHQSIKTYFNYCLIYLLCRIM
jgi:hypothetical protein